MNINLTEILTTLLFSVPEILGKDGPSAGITILTALVSLFTGRIVSPDTAMSGELTLR